uniref:Ribosomal protein S8 n=1 Tax=Thraustochytrium aureum TaxID=42467 RepID=Q9G4E3_9STRA|nr:ribosomal protein S8 [Thraustochytrium aureum]
MTSFSKLVGSFNIAAKHKRSNLTVAINSKNLRLIHLLYQEGYLSSYQVSLKSIECHFRLVNGTPLLKKILFFNSKGQQFSLSHNTLWSLRSSINHIILQTPKGLITHEKAIFYSQGGEAFLYLLI